MNIRLMKLPLVITNRQRIEVPAEFKPRLVEIKDGQATLYGTVPQDTEPEDETIPVRIKMYSPETPLTKKSEKNPDNFCGTITLMDGSVRNVFYARLKRNRS